MLRKRKAIQLLRKQEVTYAAEITKRYSNGIYLRSLLPQKSQAIQLLRRKKVTHTAEKTKCIQENLLGYSKTTKKKKEKENLRSLPISFLYTFLLSPENPCMIFRASCGSCGFLFLLFLLFLLWLLVSSCFSSVFLCILSHLVTSCVL